MKTITFDPNSFAGACPDGLCDERVRQFLTGPHDELVTSNSLTVTIARGLVHMRLYPHDKLQFKHGPTGEVIGVNADGRLNKWPQGFCDHNDRWLDVLLTPPG